MHSARIVTSMALLGMLVAGCPIPPGDPLDAGAADAGLTDTELDAGAADAGADAGADDAGFIDEDLADAGNDDTGTGDAGLADTGTIDAGEVDAEPLDAGWTDTGLDAGALDAGLADASVTIDAGTSASPPAAPTGLVATAISTFTIDLSWDSSSGEGIRYAIYRSTDDLIFDAITTTSSTSYTDSSGQPNTTYTYYVVALNASASSAASAEASALTFPAAPADLAAAPSSSTDVALTWSAPSGGADSYTIYRSTDDLIFDAIATTSSTSYTDSSGQPNTTYIYYVVAQNASASSAASAESSALTLPAVPTDLVATSSSTTDIALTWSAPSGGADSYTIYRFSSSAGFVAIATTTSTQYLDSTNAADTLSCYQVVAHNASGASTASTTASATTRTLPPASISATATSSTAASVSWATSTGASSYVVYRSTSSGSGYTPLVTTTSTSYSATELTAGTTYYFEVTANNAGGESATSSEASVIPPELSLSFTSTSGCVEASSISDSLSVTNSGGSAAYDGGVLEFCAANELRIWDTPNYRGLVIEDGNVATVVLNPTTGTVTVPWVEGYDHPSFSIGPFDEGSITLTGEEGSDFDAGVNTIKIGAAAWLDAGAAVITASAPIQAAYASPDGGAIAYAVSGQVTRLQVDAFARPHTPTDGTTGATGDYVVGTYAFPAAWCVDFSAQLPYLWAPYADHGLMRIGADFGGANTAWLGHDNGANIAFTVTDSSGDTLSVSSPPLAITGWGPDHAALTRIGLNRYGARQGQPPRITACADTRTGALTLYWDGYPMDTTSAGSGTGIWSSAPSRFVVGGEPWGYANGVFQRLQLGASADPTGRFFTPGTDHHAMLLGSFPAGSLYNGNGSANGGIRGALPSWIFDGTTFTTWENWYSDQILTSWISTYRALSHDVVVYLPADEDIVFGLSSSASQATACAPASADATYIASNISDVVSQAVADGAQVILTTIPPFGSYTPSNNASGCTPAQREEVRQATNVLIKAMADTSVTVLDLDAPFADSASPPAIRAPFASDTYSYSFSDSGFSVLIDLLAGLFP